MLEHKVKLISTRKWIFAVMKKKNEAVLSLSCRGEYLSYLLEVVLKTLKLCCAATTPFWNQAVNYILHVHTSYVSNFWEISWCRCIPDIPKLGNGMRSFFPLSEEEMLKMWQNLEVIYFSLGLNGPKLPSLPSVLQATRNWVGEKERFCLPTMSDHSKITKYVSLAHYWHLVIGSVHLRGSIYTGYPRVAHLSDHFKTNGAPFCVQLSRWWIWGAMRVYN